MIKIIQKGTRRVETCDNCGCKFSFEDEDIRKCESDMDNMYDSQFIECPQCGLRINVSRVTILPAEAARVKSMHNINIMPEPLDPTKNCDIDPFEPMC